MATQLEKPKQRTQTANSSRIDGYVKNQLKKTTQQVRVSDIATGSLTLAVFLTGFFLTVAIVDAWIWPLTITARIAALVILIVGTASIAWFQLLPYFFKKINPHFAAKMIEEAKPEFKNSLLNYLSLKKNPAENKVHRAVLGEVSKKAATDLSTITPEAAVDKSSLIRVGFILVALVAAMIAYSIFSPKNPLPTFMRVLSPASKISKPAAVSIEVLTPKDADVFFGDKPEITAKISGVTDKDEVRIVYSSVDSQIVDAVVTMNSTDSSTFSRILENGPSGIQQSLTYHVEAGDGVSPKYKINVRPNPSITIQSIHITPPKYTGLPEQIIEGQGEIQAVEGSQVEVSVLANLPIELAYIVPLIAKHTSADNNQYRELRTIQMKSEDQQAVGRMKVALNSNRDRALFTHYKVNFLSKDDFKNERPNIYPVRVIADLAPEIEIVSPATKEVTVPVNQALPVEIWASDLDYELSSIDMIVDHDGRQILEQNLFSSRQDKRAGERAQVRSSLTPSDIGLRAGDKAILYATAADNRVSTASDLPDPNVTRTENYTLIITEAVESPEQKQPEQNDRENTDDQTDEQSGDPQGQKSSQEGDQSETSDEQNSTDDSQDDQRSGDTGDSGEPSDSGSDPQSGEEGDSGDQSESSQSGDQNQTSDGNSDSEKQSESSGERNDESNSENGDASGNSDQASDPNSDPQSRDGSEGDLTDAQDQGSPDGNADSSGGSEQGGTNQRGRQGSDNNQNLDGEAGGDEFRDDSLEDGEQQPLDQDAHDGEKFERLKEYFENQKNQNRNPGDNNQNDNPFGDPESQNQPNGDQEPAVNPDNDPNNQRPTQAPENPQETPQSDSQTEGASAGDAGDQQNQPSENSNARGGDQPRDQDSNPQESPEGGGENSQDPNQDQNSPSSENGQSGSGAEQQNQNPNSEQNSNPQESNSKSDSQPSGESEKSNSQQQPSGDSQEGSSQQESSQSNSPGSESQESESGKQPGQPSEGTPSNQNDSGNTDQSGSEPSDSESASQSQPSNASSSGDDAQNAGSQTNESSDSEVSEKARRGGTSGDTTTPGSDPPDSGTPNQEKANLEYAKKVTDLVLDQLEDQKYDPDQELLDQMNWNQQDLDKFLKEWQKMKANAEAGNPKAKQDYSQRLESLGITPKTRSRKANVKKDKEFRLNENGAVDQVPREYLEKFNSFLKRRNRSKRN